MKTKSVEWSYPTSPNAKGFPRGCWSVEVAGEAVAHYAARREAVEHADRLPEPWQYPGPNETVNGQQIQCWDNGGETADRYTVLYLDSPEGNGCFGARGMSADPFHPQGFGQYCGAKPGPHNGSVIRFDALPAACQRLVRADLIKVDIARRA